MCLVGSSNLGGSCTLWAPELNVKVKCKGRNQERLGVGDWRQAGGGTSLKSEVSILKCLFMSSDVAILCGHFNTTK